MKTTHILAATLGMLAFAAQAQVAEWLPTTVAVTDRAPVEAEAAVAAAAPGQNVPSGSRSLKFASVADESAVRNDAIVANHAPDQNVSGGSRYNSRVVSTMQNPAVAQVQAIKKSSNAAQ